VAVHSKLWYLERFKLVDALDESQRRLLEETTRMQEVKRGQRIYQPGDPSEHFFLVKGGSGSPVNVVLHDLQRKGLIEQDRRVLRVLDVERLRDVK
jgi:hypothetical protein